MHIDSSVVILFGIALACFIIIRLMDNKKFGNKVVDFILLIFSFAWGVALLPLTLGVILLLSELAYHINNDIREGYPFAFWGTSVLIGALFTYWVYKKRSK